MAWLILLWIGIVGAVVLLIGGSLLVFSGIRRLRRRKAAASNPETEPAAEQDAAGATVEPSPDYPRYDAENPHYRDGYQWIDGAWAKVQVWDDASQQWFVHGVDAAGAPTAQAVGRTPPPPKPARRPGRGAVAMLTVGAVLIAAAIPLGVVSARPFLTTVAAAGGLPTDIVSESAEFRYTSPAVIDDEQPLRYEFTVDADPYEEEAYASNERPTGMVAAYYDSALTQLADYYASSSFVDNSVTLMPEVSDVRGTEGQSLIDEERSTGSWSPVDELYLVQYIDRHGAEYDKPIVTRATVRPTEGTPDTPRVQYDTTSDGYLTFTWEPVDGAANYLPVVMSTTDRGSTVYQALGIADGSATSWSTEDVAEETDVDGCYFVGSADAVQNCALRAAYQAQSNGYPTAYGVMAVGQDGMGSFIERVDAQSINRTLPSEVSIDRPAGTSSWYSGRAEDFPTRATTLTVGGTEGQVPLIFERDELNGTTGWIYARVAGTSQTLRLGWDGVDGTWDRFVGDVRTMLEEAQPDPTGIVSASYIDVAEAAPADAPLSTTQPEVDYPLPDEFGEIGEFVAANLVAGNTRISLDAVANPFDDRELVEAVIDQTPYALVRGYTLTVTQEGTRVLEVTYDHEADVMRDLQEQMRQKAEEIVAQVTSDGMSERDRALALNNWIIDNAEYDYTSFEAAQTDTSNWYAEEYRHAWRAYGIFFNGTAVCAGYAAAYKLLSDEAGLDTVYVTGDVDLNGHAWNKTYMDGKWQVVDPTWNDAAAPNQLFGITDEVAYSQFQHVEDPSDWMIPSMVAQYAAN
jgi:hypothetical protein